MCTVLRGAKPRQTTASGTSVSPPAQKLFRPRETPSPIPEVPPSYRPSSVTPVSVQTDSLDLAALTISGRLPSVRPVSVQTDPVLVMTNARGYYRSWSPLCDRFISALFADVDILETTLRELASVDFGNRPARETAMGMLRGTPSANIVSPHMRFPEEGMYVIISSGVAREYLDHIHQSCIFTESDQATAVGQRNRYDDMKMSFYKSISTLLGLLQRRHTPGAIAYGIYSRQLFESSNRIRWTEAEAPPGLNIRRNLPSASDSGFPSDNA